VLSAKENGKMKKFDDPMFLRGMNSSTDLYAIFSKQNEEYFYYKLIGTDLSVLQDKQNDEYSNFKFDGLEEFKMRNVYIVGIVQKDEDIGKLGSSWEWKIKYRGVALIDTETMEVIRLYRSRGYLYRKRFGSIVFKNYYFIQIEYDKLKIGDQFFTLPTMRAVEIYRMNGTLDTIYTYKYSNYKVFNADVKIEYEAID